MAKAGRATTGPGTLTQVAGTRVTRGNGRRVRVGRGAAGAALGRMRNATNLPRAERVRRGRRNVKRAVRARGGGRG